LEFYRAKDNISFANPFAKGCIDDYKNAILRMDNLCAQLVSLEKQRIVHMDLHSGNIMLEERKHLTDEMNAKIAITAKEESGNRWNKFPETELNHLKNEIKINMQEEDNYEYRYRIIYLEIQKKQRMKKIVK
jgi:uncharacterized Zn finger protein